MKNHCRDCSSYVRNAFLSDTLYEETGNCNKKSDCIFSVPASAPVCRDFNLRLLAANHAPRKIDEKFLPDVVKLIEPYAPEGRLVKESEMKHVKVESLTIPYKKKQSIFSRVSGFFKG